MTANIWDIFFFFFKFLHRQTILFATHKIKNKPLRIKLFLYEQTALFYKKYYSTKKYFLHGANRFCPTDFYKL